MRRTCASTAHLLQQGLRRRGLGGRRGLALLCAVLLALAALPLAIIDQLAPGKRAMRLRYVATLLGVPLWAACPARLDSAQVVKSAAYASNASYSTDFASWPHGAQFASLFPCDTHKMQFIRPTTSAGVSRVAECGNLVVSAYLDIGRSRWPSFTRSNEDYLAKMAVLLSLTNPLAIFVGHDLVSTIVRERTSRGLMDRTFVVGMPLECLPTAALADATTETMCRPEYVTGRLNDTPQRMSAWYNLMMWAKTEFVRAATLLPWGPATDAAVDYVTWVDSGCHATMCGPGMVGKCYRSVTPRVLPDKIRICQVETYTAEEQKLSAEEFAGRGLVKFAGTIFGTGRRNAARMADFFADTVRWMLAQGVADSDQSVFAYTFTQRPEAFDAHLAHFYGWGAVGKMF